LNTRSKRAPDQKKDATTDILENEFQSHPAGLASGQANTEQGKWLSPRTQVAAHIRFSRSDYANLNEMSQPEGNATAGRKCHSRKNGELDIAPDTPLPSESENELPSESENEQPSESENEQPSESENEQPSESENEQPSESENEQHRQSENQSWLKYTAEQPGKSRNQSRNQSRLPAAHRAPQPTAHSPAAHSPAAHSPAAHSPAAHSPAAHSPAAYSLQPRSPTA
jgi:hypothetical protein